MTALLDTSFLLAAAFERDQNHVVAATALRNLTSGRLVASPVEIELFFMVSARISYDRAMALFAFEIIDLTINDRQRMHEIMKQYRDARLDIADVAQLTLAERLNITRIYTFDRRDFSLFRPTHCDYLELLP
ncbi:MAG: PIN domain-containing protein [Anaerolineae bacterium]|nr:PIN domain-containing protein [Anaerolineae bacterium]